MELIYSKQSGPDFFRVKCSADQASQVIAHFASFGVESYTLSASKDKIVLNFLYFDVILKIPQLRIVMEEERLVATLKGEKLIMLVNSEELLLNKNV